MQPVEQSELVEDPNGPAAGGELVARPPTRPGPAMAVRPQAGDGSCGCGCGGRGAAGAAPAFVYAVGRIEPRFPSLGLEKEFTQATGRAQTTGLTDRQAVHAVLTQRANRYLARQLCWILTIEGLETYLLEPNDPADLDLLIEAVRPVPHPTDVDVVIGVRGPVAPPEACNGLMLPIVGVDQIYSFDVDGLIQAIPRPKDADETKFTAAAEELFGRIIQVADNAGATDEDRARNYLAVRYPVVYTRATEAHARNQALTAVEARPSSLSGARKVVEIIFSFTDRQTDVVEKSFVRVDVTEEFPFLVTKMSPYLDR
jgi:cyclic patellamide precursor peptide PatG